MSVLPLGGPMNAITESDPKPTPLWPAVLVPLSIWFGLQAAIGVALVVAGIVIGG